MKILLWLFVTFSYFQNLVSYQKMCPKIFLDHKTAFAGLLATVFNPNITSPCHNCILTKGKSIGLNFEAGQTSYSCWQLALGVTPNPLGCATDCLQNSISQCSYLRLNNSIFNASQICQACLSGLPTASSQYQLQSQCAANCAAACGFPSDCSFSSTQPTTCSECYTARYKSSRSSTWNQRQCLSPVQAGGCREHCVTNCGDGLLGGSEQCDDHNLISGDGCNSLCNIEIGYQCKNHNWTSPSICSPICGDGKKIFPEQCDDGNNIDGDGCSKTCDVEQGFSCEGDAYITSKCSPICGDLLVKGNEQCDLGNLNGKTGSGCSSTCQVINGYVCDKKSCSPICGDGVITGNEQCDTGNPKKNTGCSSSCQIEKGATCTGQPSICTTICGDGLTAGEEQCDNGKNNDVIGNGCSSTCTVTNGFNCTFTSYETGITICNPICGDSMKYGNEECDLGKNVASQGCNPNCTIVNGFKCTGGIGQTSSCQTTCGDSIVAGVEECDDGNTISGDGCSSTCKKEVAPGDNLIWSCNPGSRCQAVCSRSRIRKSWYALTAQEKQLYKEAIGLSMSSGLYAVFVGMHMEMKNDNEAHQTCAFLTWHRRYLLAFENMLRDQGPQYACVTLPYWDYYSDYANFITGKCGGPLSSCSSILGELGSNEGSYLSVNVPGSSSGSYGGSCSTGSPCNNACPLFTTSWGNGPCSKCIPRGSWTNSFPSSTGYASIASLLASSGYSEFTQQLQSGIHNAIHDAAGGMMLSMASPADPLFFSHHTSVDMLYQVFFKCKIGRKLSIREKQTNTVAYEGCVFGGASPGTPNPKSTNKLTFDTYWNGKFVQAEKHPLVQKYFMGVGTAHYEFVDSTDMGNQSYNYQVNDLLQHLMANGLLCTNPNYVLTAEEKGGISIDLSSSVYNSWYTQIWSKIDISLEERYPNHQQRLQEIAEQAEYIECLHYDRNYGCKDYSQIFKEAFNIKYKSRCKQLIEDIESGKRVVSYTNWQRDCNILRPPVMN